MTEETKKIIVPKNIYSPSYTQKGKTENSNIIGDFEMAVIEYLNGILHDDWKKHLKFKWTEQFFVLASSENSYRREIAFKSVKRGGEFFLINEKINEINDYILNCISKEEKLDAHKKRYQILSTLLYPVFEKYNMMGDVMVKLRKDTLNIHITIVYKGVEPFPYELLCECWISPKDTITPPQCDAICINTLSYAQKFIKAFTPLHDRISVLALEIRKELPQEFFIKQ